MCANTNGRNLQQYSDKEILSSLDPRASRSRRDHREFLVTGPKYGPLQIHPKSRTPTTKSPSPAPLLLLRSQYTWKAPDLVQHKTGSIMVPYRIRGVRSRSQVTKARDLDQRVMGQEKIPMVISKIRGRRRKGRDSRQNYETRHQYNGEERSTDNKKKTKAKDIKRGLRFTRAASQRTNTAKVPVTHGCTRSLDAVIEPPKNTSGTKHETNID
ncbi:unnamed protein product [Ectocarpus sp. 8 AP-2014]